MFNKILKLRKKLSWSILGNITFAFSQWLIVTLIARIGTAEDLGMYSLALAITAPIFMFFNFQLRTVLATDSDDEYTFPQYFGGRIIHLSFSYIIIGIVALIYSNDTKLQIIILIMGLAKVFESLSDICMGMFQKKSRIDLIGKSQFFRGIFTAPVVGLLYFFTHNIILSICGLLIVMVYRFIFYDLKNLKKYIDIVPTFGKSAFTIMKFAFPLGLTTLIGSLNTNIPRYFLDYFSSVEYVGIFSAIYYILTAGNLVITPITLLAAPRIANAYNSKSNKKFLLINVQLIIVSIAAFIIIIIPILLFGEYILAILYGAEYAEYKDSFIIISFAFIFNFIIAFLNLSVIAARKIKIQPIINLLTTTITIVLGFYLIKNYNVYGAAWTVLISRFFQFSLYLFLLGLIIKRRSN